jgi:phosphoglucomutase
MDTHALSEPAEDIYKIYAESFRGTDHLHRILEEAQLAVSDAFGGKS